MSTGPVVDTRFGKLRGREEHGLRVFRGIPFAKPPLGDRRFRAPEAPEPWAGVREAADFGNSAPQNPMMIPLPGMDVGETSEDCLYLNVYTPGLDSNRRPVMVWIHGGGFVIGSASQTIYDGTALARRGDLVVVTTNYRLGALGFMHLADLCPALEGVVANAGIGDQVAALAWVRENIAAFGGDPENVTIFGESAGGMSVGTLLGTPAARGLFSKAIPQSGASHNCDSREVATRVTESFLELLGLSPSEAGRALRDIAVGKLLDAQQQLLFKLRDAQSLLPFQPVVDGDFLPRAPLETLREDGAAEVALLTGTTRDEWKLFGFWDPKLRDLDEPGLVTKLEQRIPGCDARALVATYKQARQGRAALDPSSLFFAIETDRIFRLPAIRLAEARCARQQRVFMYQFDWESPMFDGALGACHAVELPFVFGALHKPGADQFVGSGPEAEALERNVMDAWIAFARSGAPGHDALRDWHAYDLKRRATMMLGRACTLEYAPADAERACWDGLL